MWFSNLKEVTITNSKKGYKIGMFPILMHLLKGAQVQNSDYALSNDEDVFWETRNKLFLEGAHRRNIRVPLQAPL